jgi:peptide/nickel transport system substrate-binding protein
MRLCAAFVLAFGIAAAPALAEPDTLRIRLKADIRSLDPGVNRDANTDAVQAHLFEGLVAFRENASVGPLLAKSYEISPDGLTYVFTLRDDLRFSNGEPVSADDVLFSWQRYTNPATGWRCLAEVDGRGSIKVVNVVAPDDRTVAFTLEKPSAVFLATLARPDCGGTGIFHRSSLGPDGQWRDPVTTGPFKLGSWKRGQSIELLRNENYTALPGGRDGLTGDKTAQVAKAQFIVIPDEATTKAALITGGIDVNFDIDNTSLAEYRAASNLRLDSVPLMNTNAFLFQTKDPLLADPRIRRAFLLSLDMEELVNAATEGQARPNNSPIPSPSAYHGPLQSEVSKRDLAQAKKLLAEAGYKGQPIKMIANKAYTAMYNDAIIAQAMAREAGINIELEILDWGAQQDRYLSGDYQMMSYGYSARLDPSLSFEMFTGPKEKQPRKVWENPEALALLDKSMAVSEPGKRQLLLDEMERLYRADVPMIVVYSEVRTSAVRTNVTGFRGWALGHPRAWGVSVK